MRGLGQRLGRDLIGLICTVVVWVAWNFLSKVAALLQGGRRPGRDLHARDGRPPRRPAARGLRRPGHDPVSVRSGHRPPDLRADARPAVPVLGERPVLHGVGTPAVGAVPSGRVGHHLVGADHLHPDEAHRPGATWGPLQGRGPRGRRSRHPRRGSLPRGDARPSGSAPSPWPEPSSSGSRTTRSNRESDQHSAPARPIRLDSIRVRRRETT